MRLGLRVLMCPEQVYHHSGHPPPPGRSHLGHPLQHLGVTEGPRGPLPLPTSLRKSLRTLPQTLTQTHQLSLIPRCRPYNLNRQLPLVRPNIRDRNLYTRNSSNSSSNPICALPRYQPVTKKPVHSRKIRCSLKYKIVSSAACQEST